jgi:DNA-binding response OmpR family regulator
MSGPHVLVVEDERDIADLYAAQLREAYDTTVTYDGEQALQVLDERGDGVDIVLLDRLMPGLSGDEVLAAIRDRELSCSVAMVTAVDPDFDIVQLGFDDYLTKPVSEARLRETVERLVAQSTYDEQVREHLAMVRTRTLLEAEKGSRELAESEEYTQLRKDIVDSRRQLDDALSGDVLVELLLRETGDNLYIVLQYDADSWDYRYVGDAAEEMVASMNPDIEEILPQFRREGREQTRLNDTFELGGYFCSLHLFDAVVVLHFYKANQQGVVCGFDPDTAPNLTDFVSLVHPYIRRDEWATVETDGEAETSS